MRICWCRNSDCIPFGAGYGECRACGTLVCLEKLSSDHALVRDDETDFYGKKYWLQHQCNDLELPDIYERSRNDISERCMHWLKTLFKYRLFPAKVLELGCSHGGFTALLNKSGYDAVGVEMSPWVVDYAQKTFGIPVFVGPIENLDISRGSLDVIVLMDVPEHLSDPAATMAHCLHLLKADGLLLIQTLQFRMNMRYDDLVENGSPFLSQLTMDEHLYLFSKRSITEFFHRLGADYIAFESAIFAQYDMFFAVSRIPVKGNTLEQIDAALLGHSGGRHIQALLDLRAREVESERKLLGSEVDRMARGLQVNTLTSMLQDVELDRAARGEQIETLTSMLKSAELDRAARGEQIETLTAILREVEAERVARGEQIESLVAGLRALFARPVFRRLTGLAGWPEVNKLAEWVVTPDE